MTAADIIEYFALYFLKHQLHYQNIIDYKSIIVFNFMNHFYNFKIKKCISSIIIVVEN